MDTQRLGETPRAFAAATRHTGFAIPTTTGERSNRQQPAATEAEKLSVHELIRRGAGRYVAEYCDSEATLGVQSVLSKISLCRATALGGRWYECDDCQQITKLHNSCGDRHCPACSGARRYAWNEETSKLLLPDVTYYQVVFTLPEILSTLALANRKELADVLFQSAWKSLKKTISIEQDYDPAAMMVLHTWNQKLEAHWHVHALVPGGGPNLIDGSWTEATAPHPDGVSGGRKYLVDATNLRTSFRKFAIAHLKRLRRKRRQANLNQPTSRETRESRIRWSASTAAARHFV